MNMKLMMNNGNELSTYNPNSKWDWYEIGGRWRNLLLTKINNEDVISEIDLVDLMNKGNNLEKEAPIGYKWVDGARIKDIDFKKAAEIKNTYNKAIRFWETYVEGQKPTTEEEKEDIEFELYKKEYYIERYETKENYAKMQSAFSCWALLDETGWHEKGKMGWWGMNDSTKDSEQLFLEKFTETINKPENQDKYLIIVDCHIQGVEKMNKKYYKRINNLDIALEETNHKYIMIHQWSVDNSHKMQIGMTLDVQYNQVINGLKMAAFMIIQNYQEEKMSREIKFRGKTNANNDWIYGDFIHQDKFNRPMIKQDNYTACVSENTLGQYTRTTR